MRLPVPLPRPLIALPLAGLLAFPFASQASEGEARVMQAAPGQALTAPSQASPAAIVAGALRARGRADLRSQLEVETDRGGHAGMRHVKLQQHVNGVPVHGATLRATLNARGELLHLIDRSVDATTLGARARVSERQALDAAMARVHPGVVAPFATGVRHGRSMRFEGGGFFHEAPTVSRVLLPQAGGALAEGFLVQTWTQRGNLLDHTVVDGSGRVVSVERRTSSDSYNVFAVDPSKTPQAIVTGPGTQGNAQSPAGWLGSGTQTTTTLNGNNVSAYLDANADNRPDTGGTTVTTGNFVTAANLTSAPTTTGNRAVAVQNVFYLNNVIHDRLYRHGFNEAEGNFQVDNFGKGGLGNDPVNAEAQDGGGLDNANFATPLDGQRPRMQMYLWNGAGATHEVVVSGVPAYPARIAQFGSSLSTTGLTGTVVLGNDGVAASGGGTVNDGCEALPSTVRGRIVLLDRGLCGFTVKVRNAAAAGAAGVIIANNVPGDPFAMGGTLNVRIPAVMISQASGNDLRVRVNASATMRRKAVQPLQIDGSLDSDVVFHEYGHGLTWRMIGGMSGPLAGAIGEGASDTVAFMVNGDDVIGEYAASNPAGIRRYRYAGYPLSYANVTGAEVHNDGEIYAAAMWRLRELWLASNRTNDTLFDHFVDGMRYTPSTPAFEDMRNGMLQSIATSAGTDATARCALVWRAFAQFGIGDGAKGTVLGSTSVSIVPSNVPRGDCTY